MTTWRIICNSFKSILKLILWSGGIFAKMTHIIWKRNSNQFLMTLFKVISQSYFEIKSIFFEKRHILPGEWLQKWKMLGFHSIDYRFFSENLGCFLSEIEKFSPPWKTSWMYSPLSPVVADMFMRAFKAVTLALSEQCWSKISGISYAKK